MTIAEDFYRKLVNDLCRTRDAAIAAATEVQGSQCEMYSAHYFADGSVMVIYEEYPMPDWFENEDKFIRWDNGSVDSPDFYRSVEACNQERKKAAETFAA